MTRVDFYVLSDTDPLNRLRLICKLADKAMVQKQRVYIYGEDQKELAELDDRLWDFRTLSFAAHRLVSSDEINEYAQFEVNDPILLSDAELGTDRTVLINMSKSVPPFFSRFERTLEIVNRQTDVQLSGRERYVYYKQRGYPLQHHAM